MPLLSQMKGPTAGAADTETRIGGADFEFPTKHSHYTITEIRVGYGHVVDAKSPCAVLEVKITGVNGPFKWVIGSGAGGAATTSVTKPDIIDCNIIVPGGAKVGVYVTFADAAADVIATLRYKVGSHGRMSYSDMPALTAALVADTRTSFGSITLLPGAWTLRKLRVGLGQVVDAKAATVKIEIDGIDGVEIRESTFGFGSGSAGATNSGHQPAEEQELDYPCSGMKSLTVYATAAEAAVESGYSIQYD